MSVEKMKTFDAKALMNMDLPDIQFVVESLIPQGLHILAGSPKAGKSWLLLSLCLQVAKGYDFWKFKTKQGTVLYLCLEDSQNRLQSRLEELTDEPPENMHFATMVNSLADGLIEQIDNFIFEHKDTVLVVIDTLQKVRNVMSDANPYANDYKDIGQMKELADKHGIAMIVVQHLRKQFDSDPHSMVTGSTGLIGAADGSYVLKREQDSDGTAKLYVRGRDVEEQILTIHFDKETMLWDFVSSDTLAQEQMNKDNIIPLLLNYLKKEKEFRGTAAELSEKLKIDCGTDVTANVLSRKLKKFTSQLLEKGVIYSKNRTGNRREIILSFSADDGNDANDDIIGS